MVIRIVYDGPPLAGKTTSVRALASGLGRVAESREEEEGRTLFFDWLEYEGGIFEGRPIRCQVVSTPGQPSLSARREYLLERADVIIAVIDSSERALETNLNFLASTSTLLRRHTPPIGVVLQANKRDLPDAVELTRLRRLVEGLPFQPAVLESVATAGEGAKLAFVFAVRLALDRAREELRTATLESETPEFASSESLFTALATLAPKEGAPPIPAALFDRVEAPRVRSDLENEPGPRGSTGDGEEPRSPSAEAPAGLVWPPVEGRIRLHGLSLEAARPARDGRGNWQAMVEPGWRMFSPASAVYPNPEEGRSVLIRWARLITAAVETLSPKRCLALAATGHGDFRLWQILPQAEPLNQRLAQELHGRPAAEALHRLEAELGLCLALAEELDHREAATLALDTVAIEAGKAVRIGPFPELDRSELDLPSQSPQRLAALEESLSTLILDTGSDPAALRRALVARLSAQDSESPLPPALAVITRVLEKC